MLEIITLVLVAAAVILSCISLFRKPQKPNFTEIERLISEEMRSARKESGENVGKAVQNAAQTQNETQRQISEVQNHHLKELSNQLSQKQTVLQQTMQSQMAALDERFKNVSMQNEQKLENVRKTMEERLLAMQSGNEKKLDEMRVVVDEKLQKTLNERLKQSFSLVNERLEQVYKGLGEMQNLAAGVGDLKKVLSNVKTRGILGEIQLGAILEEILSVEQYAKNIATVPGSNDRVEFAVKLPGDGAGDVVWLPIDAKFPSDAYANLLEAYDVGESAAVEAAATQLDRRIRGFAKDIRTKYVHVPQTTDFAVMFLPVEGLYAEVVRRGLVEKLQNEYKINIAGPTTMAALLNSLQMGFRTLAIQKRTSEVWEVLGDVKSEFSKFEKVLEKTKQHLDQASRDIEELAGVRTRQIQRKLRDVTVLSIDEKDSDKEAIPESSTAE